MMRILIWLYGLFSQQQLKNKKKKKNNNNNNNNYDKSKRPNLIGQVVNKHRASNSS